MSIKHNSYSNCGILQKKQNNKEIYLQSEIFKISKLVKQRQQELEDFEYEVDLLKVKEFEIYKNNVFYLISDFLKDFGSWVNCLSSNKYIDGTKLDKRKSYKEKNQYEYVVKWISKMIGHKINVCEYHTSVGCTRYSTYYGYGYTISFTCDDIVGKKFAIYIPIISNIDYEVFENERAFCFKIHLIEEKGDTSTVFFSTFFEDELKEGFAEYLSINNVIPSVKLLNWSE